MKLFVLFAEIYTKKYTFYILYYINFFISNLPRKIPTFYSFYVELELYSLSTISNRFVQIYIIS